MRTRPAVTAPPAQAAPAGRAVDGGATGPRDAVAGAGAGAGRPHRRRRRAPERRPRPGSAWLGRRRGGGRSRASTATSPLKKPARRSARRRRGEQAVAKSACGGRPATSGAARLVRRPAGAGAGAAGAGGRRGGRRAPVAAGAGAGEGGGARDRPRRPRRGRRWAPERSGGRRRRPAPGRAAAEAPSARAPRASSRRGTPAATPRRTATETRSAAPPAGSSSRFLPHKRRPAPASAAAILSKTRPVCAPAGVLSGRTRPAVAAARCRQSSRWRPSGRPPPMRNKVLCSSCVSTCVNLDVVVVAVLFLSHGQELRGEGFRCCSHAHELNADQLRRGLHALDHGFAGVDAQLATHQFHEDGGRGHRRRRAAHARAEGLRFRPRNKDQRLQNNRASVCHTLAWGDPAKPKLPISAPNS